jgi:hypothetical protein
MMFSDLAEEALDAEKAKVARLTSRVAALEAKLTQLGFAWAIPPLPCVFCHDTGVIETGNSDYPCSCPAGDRAKFNVSTLVPAGGGRMTPVMETITGAEMKRRGL